MALIELFAVAPQGVRLCQDAEHAKIAHAIHHRERFRFRALELGHCHLDVQLAGRRPSTTT
jgi:hypothetical protein